MFTCLILYLLNFGFVLLISVIFKTIFLYTSHVIGFFFAFVHVFSFRMFFFLFRFFFSFLSQCIPRRLFFFSLDHYLKNSYPSPLPLYSSLPFSSSLPFDHTCLSPFFILHFLLYSLFINFLLPSFL